MAFKHGKNTKVLINQYDISAHLNDTSVEAKQDNPVTTTYGATGVRRQVVGLKDAMMTFAGLHDTVAGGSHPVFTGLLGAAAAVVVTRGVEGLAIGAPVELLSGRTNSHSTGSPVDGVVPISGNVEGDGGVDYGKSHHELSAETATGDSASVDNGASSANGGVAHIHATASSGTPTLDARIQHGTDDIVFVDLIVFAQLTGAGYERATSAAGTTVDRYTRNRHVIGGGSPNITYASAFARR